MKASKYVLIAAAIAAVALIVAWFLRDSLIQRISNPLLDDYGISVTDVSLDALATDDATIGYLELVHDKGTTIAVEDLTLPFGTASGEPKTYTASKVTIITSTRTEGELFELAQLINQFISLPERLADSEANVAEFSLPPYPSIHDLRWALTGNEQRILGTIDSITVSATISRTDTTRHAVVFSVPDRSTPAKGHSIAAELKQSDQRISLNGLSSVDLLTWGPVARLSGVIPSGIEPKSGSATLQFDVEIPNDATQSPKIVASLASSSPVHLTYTSKSDEVTSVLVDTAAPVEIAATFPTVEWSLQQPHASLLVSYGDWLNIPVALNDVSCKTGPVCSMSTRVAMDAAELPIGKIERFEFVSNQNVTFGDGGTRIDIRPDAVLTANNLAANEASVNRVEGKLESEATLELTDAGWQFSGKSVDAKIDSLSMSDNQSVSMPLFLENVLISNLDLTFSLASGLYVPSSLARLNEQDIALPGFKGDVSLRENSFAFDLATVGLFRNGIATVNHDFDTRKGQLNVRDVVLSFETKHLSDRISPLPGNSDLVAGTVAFDFDADWRPGSSGLELGAQFSGTFSDLAGYYADTAFAGLSTQAELLYRSATGFEAQPSTITVALIDAGLPVENLSAQYTLDPNARSVDVRNLGMAAFGGEITADPFIFSTETGSNTLTLHADSVELNKLLSLGEFEAIEVSGAIDAMLPVKIEGNVVTIEHGTLTGDPEGGVIRYMPGGMPDETDTSAIGLARRALSNFEFNTLTSDVDLTREGDLNLQLQLTGRNPDLDGERPVVLNLGVENNIPQMLKSLRAARAVEDILERRLNE